MNNKELQEIKGTLIEVGIDHLCGSTKGVYLDEVEKLFNYIKELKLTDKLLRTKISQLRKEIK